MANLSKFQTPQNYKDLDGNMKTFTVIDHDVKTTISASDVSLSKEKAEILSREYRELLVERILSIHPSLCPWEFMDFTVRGGKEAIEWNEVMLRDDGMGTDRLRTLCVLVENASERPS